MNLNERRIGNIVLLLFVLSVALSGYYLVSLPANLINSSSIDETVLQEAQHVLSDLSLIIAVSFVLGLSTAVLFLLSLRKSENKLKVEYVRVDKSQDKRQDTVTDQEGAEVEGTEDIKALISQQTDPAVAYSKVLSEVCNRLEAVQGALYLAHLKDDLRVIRLETSYAFVIPDSQQLLFEFGEGLAGQAAKQDKQIIINEVPKGYISVVSGLGESEPGSLIITPIRHQGKLIGVAEIARFGSFGQQEKAYLQAIFDALGAAFDHEPHQIEEETTPSSDQG